MESMTKNKQSLEVLQQMVERCFPTDSLESAKELTEGYFNVAYLIRTKSGASMILKIAPLPEARVMSYEKNLMASEVDAMRRVAATGGIPAPKVLGYDDSHTICPSSYFFMDRLDGDSLNSIREQLTDAECDQIQEVVGAVNHKINDIICPRFGYPGQESLQGEQWYEVFWTMILLAIEDAKRGNVDLKIDTNVLLKQLENDRSLFDAVKNPRMVHWDCWDGNIFVKDKKFVGLIDWERCIWADPLMEVGFRTYEDHKAFQKGYGITKLSNEEERRALWYDIYALLLMTLECEYRKYDTMEMYEWGSSLLSKQVEKLINNKIDKTSVIPLY